MRKDAEIAADDFRVRRHVHVRLKVARWRRTCGSLIVNFRSIETFARIGSAPRTQVTWVPSRSVVGAFLRGVADPAPVSRAGRCDHGNVIEAAANLDLGAPESPAER